MECTDLQAIVAGEREDDLSADESQRFETHLDACAVCREAVSRAEEDLERLGQLAEPPLLAPSAWARVDEAVRAQARRKPGRGDPFAPLRDQPLEPAMPVTLAPAARSRPSLAFVAFAAAAVVAGAFLAFELPARPATPRGLGVPVHGQGGDQVVMDFGKVTPPEEGDVKVLADPKLGPGFQKLQGQTLIVIPDGQ